MPVSPEGEERGMNKNRNVQQLDARLMEPVMEMAKRGEYASMAIVDEIAGQGIWELMQEALFQQKWDRLHFVCRCGPLGGVHIIFDPMAPPDSIRIVGEDLLVRMLRVEAQYRITDGFHNSKRRHEREKWWKQEHTPESAKRLWDAMVGTDYGAANAGRAADESLRDRFAMAALTGLISVRPRLNTNDIDDAWRIADAMMAERGKK